MKIYRKCLVIGLIILFVGTSFGACFEPLSCDANGPYEGNIMEDIEFEGTVTGGSPPYEYFWDYGDGNTSSGDPHPTHNYANAANYTVIFTVTDSEKDTASDTTWAYINAPPNTPVIDGPNSGKPGIKYEYCIIASDPDNDTLFVLWNWGDGTSSDWLGPLESGMEVCDSHIWNETGTYNISVTVRDEYGVSVTAYKAVTIPRSRATTNTVWYQWFLERFPLLEKLLGLIRSG